MTLRINDTAPNFTVDTTQGKIDFHNWLGDGWGMIFSHPKDFTPVCATELGAVAQLKSEFDSRNCKVIGISVDSVEDHNKWAIDIADIAGTTLNFPIIGDGALEVSKLYDMLPATEANSSEGRTAADNQTVRVVFLVGPDKKIKMNLAYPMSTGRNFYELLRVIDSCQLTQQYKVATPANWQRGDDVIISPAVDNDTAKELFPGGWDTVKPYLRKVKDPTS
ncbi:peroxiredoxin [SAR202 cluster bacterium AC-409-J13_OGT_754m]|nr:peroxiredoxin [SAR202 cluster bacterium AC-409-J13_OGT_754m]